jgi:hypothetical protein
MTASAPLLSKTFPLKPGVLADGSAASVELDATTSADVFEAIVNNGRFPSSPDGRIELGRVVLKTEAGRDVRLRAGAATVAFKASAGVRAAVAVYGAPADALQALEIDAPEGLDLDLASDGATRHLLLLWGYEAEGGVSGSHPIGLLGSLGFGVEGRRESAFAVLHSFAEDRGAGDVLRETIGSWMLPRHVRTASELAPRTWLIAEANGSLALKLTAQLGWDFSFVRELKALGLAGDVGLKLETGLEAAVGLEASGRYLVVLGREAADPASPVLRLRLFKTSKKGWSFGLNLAARVETVADVLPDEADELVKAVFGVHGQQVVQDLLVLEKWTDPEQDLSDTVARLSVKSARELIRTATGLDPLAEFEKARGVVVNALQTWDALPDRVSSVLWSLLPRLEAGGAEREALESFLRAVAAEDPDERTRALQEALGSVAFFDTAGGRLLEAAADKGLLALLERSAELQPVARGVLAVLDAEVIRALQTFIEERLDLGAVRRAVTAADFARLDEWLVKKLSDVLDRTLAFEDLDAVKDLIGVVIRKRQEVYATVKRGLERHYDVELAHGYEKSTAKTALLDVSFDLDRPEAAALLEAVLDRGELETLLVRPRDGVRLAAAVLSHEISRRSSVEVELPHFSERLDTLAASLARVRAEEDCGRVFFYDLDASDTVTVANRLKSALTVSSAFAVNAGGVRRRRAASFAWSYQYRYAQRDMRRADLEYLLAPLVQEYLPGKFGAGASSLDTWIADLDRAVEDAVHNGTNELGDVLVALEASIPARALAAWFRPRSDAERRADALEVSRRVQRKLKQLLSFLYLRDPRRLRQDFSTAALLVYASIPASTSIEAAGGHARLDVGPEVHWDWPSPEQRSLMVRHPSTIARLAVELHRGERRLLAGDDPGQAAFFERGSLERFVSLATSGAGERLLTSLLACESDVVSGAERALRDVSGLVAASASRPEQAIERLAEFGASLTGAFHDRIRSVYGGDGLRALGSMVFLEASCALDAGLRLATPNALLSLTVLKERSTFALESFLAGQKPAREDVALEQRLVSDRLA